MQPSLLGHTQRKDKRQQSQVTTRKISVGPKEKAFHDDTDEQTDKKGCGISILGDFRKSTEQDPEQPHQSWRLPCFKQEIGLDELFMTF